MDKKSFSRLAETMQNIKISLLNNEELRRLLVLDNPNGLDETPSLNATYDYIYTQPIVDVDVDGAYNKSMYITITLKSSTYTGEDKIQYILRVMPMIDKHKYIYDNDKIRIFKILQIIVDTIENTKYSLSGPMTYLGLSEAVTNPDVTGFALNFSAVDGVGKQDDTK